MEIRLAAVRCCVQIVKPFIKVFDVVENAQKLEVYKLIRNVLDCLIKVAVTDPGKLMCNVHVIVLFQLCKFASPC